MTNIELCEAVRELPDEIQAVRLVYGDHERNTLLDVADLKRWATDYERLLAAAKGVRDIGIVSRYGEDLIAAIEETENGCK